MRYVTLDDETFANLNLALDNSTTVPPGEEEPEEPEEPLPPQGGDCEGGSDCHFLNPRCIAAGFWGGWCVDDVDNFRQGGIVDGGEMTHNATCLHRPPKLDRLGIRFGWDSRFHESWLLNTAAPGQHLAGLWAVYGQGKTREEHSRRHLRVDFSRQAPNGFDVVLQGMKDSALVMDARINTRVAGAYVPGQWQRTVVSATYDRAAGRVSGVVEYVGKGLKSFSLTDLDIRDFPVWWNWYGFGNVDTGADHFRSPFGFNVRNVTCEVF